MSADRVAHADAAVLITLDQASVRFGALNALDGVSLRLHRGERLAIVGSNGSGKTTLLRLLHGLLGCDSGQRIWHGHSHPHSHLPTDGATAGPAMVFQRPFLLGLSARRNLRIAAWLQGLPRSERAATCDHALLRFGLAAQAGQRATALSGGQQQRLALARAWLTRPALLLLDEPTAHLDPHGKQEVETLIAEFASDAGTTLCFSTHNLGQAKRLATRVVYLEAGRLIVDLPVARFFNGPLPAAATRFLKAELPWD